MVFSLSGPWSRRRVVFRTRDVTRVSLPFFPGESDNENLCFIVQNPVQRMSVFLCVFMYEYHRPIAMLQWSSVCACVCMCVYVCVRTDGQGTFPVHGVISRSGRGRWELTAAERPCHRQLALRSPRSVCLTRAATDAASLCY